MKIKKAYYIYLILIVLIGLSSFFFFWFQKTTKTVVSDNSQNKYFVIKQGEGVWDIAKNLEKEGLIRDDKAFVLFLRTRNLTRKLQAGEYLIPQNLNIIGVSEIITNGKVAKNKITIPEGWDNEKVAAFFEEKGIGKKEDFLMETKNVKKYSESYPFLTEFPADATLEGFLYPDTYETSVNPTQEEMIKKMLSNFEKKLTPDLRAQAKTKGLSIFDLVRFASVVEREVSKPEDRKKVAGVFWNRYNIGMRFESDATIQYILKSNVKTFTYDETKTLSPYNTYLNKGLPKGPIANPGIDSIKAVLEPEDSDYLYFLSASGITYYSKTLDEHETKKQKYLK